MIADPDNCTLLNRRSVTLHGRGCHGSQPHNSIDPVVMAANTVVRLQTITSREINPSDFAVLTVGALNAGDTENVIPDKAELKINIRTYSKENRTRVVEAMKRIIKAESEASGAPKEPDIEEMTRYPLTVNDEDIAASIKETFSQHFPSGPQGFVEDVGRLTASEDFGILGSAIDRPYCFFVYGGTDPHAYDEAQKKDRMMEIAGNHSPFFAPVIQPTMRVGTEGYAAAALTFLAK